MTLGHIVLKLRQADTYFKNNIVGAVNEEIAKKSILNNYSIAFIIPNKIQTVSENILDSGINQLIDGGFSILIALRNDTTQSDKLGVTSYSLIDNIRTQFFKALLGWLQDNDEYIISYDSGKLMNINSAYLLYSFKFNAG